MVHMTRRIRVLLIGGLVAIGAMTAVPVSASAPVRFGPNTYDYNFIGFNCDGFDIQIAGAGTDRATVFFDGSGNVVKFAIYGRFPHDVLTNTVTGRSVIVRAEFNEFFEPIPGTDEFSKTVVGFRYMVNEPGSGTTIKEVGKISFADLQQLVVTFQAGKHDLALDEALLGAFCTTLA